MTVIVGTSLLLCTPAAQAIDATRAIDVLSQFYRAQIKADTCSIRFDADLQKQVDADRTSIENILNYSATDAIDAYAKTRAVMQEDGPICNEEDDVVADAKVAIYAYGALVKQLNAEPIQVLGGLYMAVAISEYCKVPIDPKAAALLGADAVGLEHQLGIDDAASSTKYQAVLDQLRQSPPDCGSNTGAVATMHAVIDGYLQEAQGPSTP